MTSRRVDPEASLASSSLDEHPLPAGRLTRGVVRVGDTVRRPSKDSSPFVARLLGRFEDLNVSWAPRYLGEDALGRDILTFLPGSVPLKWCAFTDRQICEAARLLRHFHDATRGSDLAGHCSVVCHNDPGPSNMVFRDHTPYAFIDFDMAAPGEPLVDLGYMAWAWCISSKQERQPAHEQARQVRMLVDAYDLDADRAEVLPAILERLEQNIRFWSEKLNTPDTTAVTTEKMTEIIEWSRRELVYTLAKRDVFAAALR